MSMSFPIELKTGFFQVEHCILKIDSKAMQIMIEFEKNSDAYLIEFSSIKTIIFNPYMKNEIEILTDHNTYVGNLNKDEIHRGYVDFIKNVFGERFKEIKY